MLQPAILLVPFASTTPMLLADAVTAGYSRHTAIRTSQEPKSGSEAPAAGGAPTAGTAVPGTPGAAGAQGANQAPMGGGSDLLLYMGLAVVVMLFLSMRRDSKARKEQQAMLSSIKQGDRIVTTAGIHGVVHRLDEKTVTLLLDTAQVTFDRAAISRVVRDEAARVEAKRA